MSEDRFKQARRSLIDRHNQRQQQDQGQQPQGQHPQGDTFDDDFEDEATALVNIDARQRPQFAPPPNFEDSPPDEATEMFSVDQNFEAAPAPAPPQGDVQMRTHSGVQPSYDRFRQDHQGQQQGHAQQQQWDQGQQHQQHWDQHADSSAQWDQGQQNQQHWDQHADSSAQWDQQQNPGHAANAPSPDNSLVIGEGGGYDGNTQFVNLSDFAAGESFTPDESTAGYEGSTQFVNLNALQAGAAAEAQAQSVENDPVLRQSYQYGPESIQDGEFTLIFAQSPEGRPVVLKRIWEGDPNKMPMPVRQRVAALDEIRHPQLIALNGMLASQSGAWVELDRPPGYRLTDIIQQNGPQDPDAVTGWMKQVADVLTAVHQRGFVYANLTPDAIWVQDDGSILLEPFDILAFEHRGNLGAFGPPEMNFPPEQRQLYPSTDIYCLAAVTVSAIAGLPLNLAAAQSFDKKLSRALDAALQQNPQERPQSAQEFADSLEGSGGGLDMKFIIIAVAVIGVAALGTVYYMQQMGRGGGNPAPKSAAKQAPVDGPAEKAPSEEPSAEEGAAAVAAAGDTAGEDKAAAPPAADADAPAVEQDPRLRVETSLRLNPVADQEESREAENDPEQAAAARAEVKELLDGVEKLVKDQQREKYAQAMAKLADAIRYSGGDPTDEDRELMKDLFSRDIVQDIQKDYFKRVNENLRDEKISRVKSIYPKLAAVDASANEFDFFNKNKGVGVKRIERTDGPSSDDDEAEETDE